MSIEKVCLYGANDYYLYSRITGGADLKTKKMDDLLAYMGVSLPHLQETYDGEKRETERPGSD